MDMRSRNLLLLLALTAIPLPVRGVWVACHMEGPGSGHVHHREHAHGGVPHTHAHHHHKHVLASDAEDHHCVLDHVPDGPKIDWTSPPRTANDSAPRRTILATAAIAPVGVWEPVLSARPPPHAIADTGDLISIRTVVLRL